MKKLRHCHPMHTQCLKNVTTLSRNNFDTYEPILLIFGPNVTEKVSN